MRNKHSRMAFPLEVMDVIAKRLSMHDLKNIMAASQTVKEKVESMPLIWKRHVQNRENKCRNNKYLQEVKKEYTLTKAWTKKEKYKNSTTYVPDAPVTRMEVYGDILVVSSDAPVVRIYDVQMKSICQLVGHRGAVWTFDCRDTLLITGSTDKTAKIWDCILGVCIKTLVGHTATIRCVKFADECVITGARDKTIRVWSIVTGACKYVLKGHKGSIRDMVVIQNKPLVVSASYDGTVMMWNYKTGESVSCLGVFSRRVYALCSVNNAMAMGGIDQVVKVVPVNGDKQAPYYTNKHGSTVYKIRADACGCIYTMTVNSTVTKWDTNKKCMVYEIHTKGKPVNLHVLNHLLVIGTDTGIHLYNKSTGAAIKSLCVTNKMYAMCTTQNMIFWAERRNVNTDKNVYSVEIHTMHYDTDRI